MNILEIAYFDCEFFVIGVWHDKSQSEKKSHDFSTLSVNGDFNSIQFLMKLLHHFFCELKKSSENL